MDLTGLDTDTLMELYMKGELLVKELKTKDKEIIESYNKIKIELGSRINKGEQ